MVLAEKYALKPEFLVPDPQIEIARKQCCNVARIRLEISVAEFRQELEYPRFDHRMLFPSVPSIAEIAENRRRAALMVT
jgi:hypothetical protein